MASGTGGVMQVIWIIVILYIIVEFGIPLGKKLVGEITSMRAKSYVTRSYM